MDIHIPLAGSQVDQLRVREWRGAREGALERRYGYDDASTGALAGGPVEVRSRRVTRETGKAAFPRQLLAGRIEACGERAGSRTCSGRHFAGGIELCRKRHRLCHRIGIEYDAAAGRNCKTKKWSKCRHIEYSSKRPMELSTEAKTFHQLNRSPFDM